MTESIGFVAEVEQGSEIQFCPIRQQPIVRSQRVRTLPGFHLLSLGAGREALARGYYEAFGQRFSCTELEYLHPDDKVFICAEDHKAFKNRMSMQYHRYIRHELEERKLERKRMRERAAERQARSLAHAARQQQAPPVAAQKAVTSGGREADPRTVSTSSAAPPAASTAGAEAASQLLADNDPYADSAESRVTHDPYAVAEDGEPPSDAPAPLAVPVSTTTTVAVAASKPPASAPPPAVVAQPPKQVAQVKAVAADEDDLYGDMTGPDVKKQKTASTYASAIGAMMTDDFDDDE